MLERNFGGGWESLPQSVQDIIQSGFDISTTTLPTDRLKKPGGLYDKKTADGFEVLEISKGSWTEAIFAKEKPMAAVNHIKFSQADELESDEEEFDNYDEDEDLSKDKKVIVQHSIRILKSWKYKQKKLEKKMTFKFSLHLIYIIIKQKKTLLKQIQ